MARWSHRIQNILVFPGMRVIVPNDVVGEKWKNWGKNYRTELTEEPTSCSSSTIRPGYPLIEVHDEWEPIFPARLLLLPTVFQLGAAETAKFFR